MFWEDTASVGRGGKAIRVMPPIPETGWLPPTEFPNLSAARVISIDCETKDPDLLTHGPGWARSKGHIVGISVGADSGGRWYFPIRHEVEPEHNLCPEKVFEWIRDTLSNPSQPKVGANIMYDVGWLRHEGVTVAGELVDVQYAEALLDERAEVSLEVLAQKYLGEGKKSSLLYQWCADFYGGKPNSSQRANIYRSPPRLVGPYAESDADLPLRLARIMHPLLLQEKMVDLFRMECGLIPMLLDMRFAGVTVNVARAEELRDILEKREQEEASRLTRLTGCPVDINSAESLAKIFKSSGLAYKHTLKGKPSFTKDFLQEIQHPVAAHIREIRKLAKLRGTFVESYILDSHVNGRVFGQFHPLRSDEGGTRSGRFSSSTPNLQNLPSRDDELAPLVRGLFIPDSEHIQWRKYDYSQIEYRFLAHFAVGQMADKVRSIFSTDPKADYHEMTQELVHQRTGKLLGRKPTKTINFGLIYGMGVPKLAASLGLSAADGKELFSAYHKGAPFAKATMEKYSSEAREAGTIKTILGRKSRFDLWEPSSRGAEGIALPYNEALMKYGQVRRAYTHKALNRLLQGSAADLMKLAMWKCYTSGIFKETGVPRLTVHDELDFSDQGGKESSFREMKHVLENALSLRVPVLATCEVGPDWGHTDLTIE